MQCVAESKPKLIKDDVKHTGSPGAIRKKKETKETLQAGVNNTSCSCSQSSSVVSRKSPRYFLFSFNLHISFQYKTKI